MKKILFFPIYLVYGTLWVLTATVVVLGAGIEHKLRKDPEEVLYLLLLFASAIWMTHNW